MKIVIEAIGGKKVEAIQKVVKKAHRFSVKEGYFQRKNQYIEVLQRDWQWGVHIC